jgi:hypothetical protein
MKHLTKQNWLARASLLLALPTAYFIIISVLKYGLNIDGPSDQATPFLERMGLKENLGWNINLLLLFGPLMAFLLTIFQVLTISWKFTKERLAFHFIIRKKGLPLLVVVLSGGLLLILFIYLAGENF